VRTLKQFSPGRFFGACQQLQICRPGDTVRRQVARPCKQNVHHGTFTGTLAALQACRCAAMACSAFAFPPARSQSPSLITCQSLQLDEKDLQYVDTMFMQGGSAHMLARAPNHFGYCAVATRLRRYKEVEERSLCVVHGEARLTPRDKLHVCHKILTH
jgi:hypothetical protein